MYDYDEDFGSLMRTGKIHQIQTPRKVYHQVSVDIKGDWDRARLMSEQAARAVTFLSSLPNIDWLTLEFRVVNNGTEPVGTEVWRWEAWMKG